MLAISTTTEKNSYTEKHSHKINPCPPYGLAIIYGSVFLRVNLAHMIVLRSNPTQRN